MGAYYYSIDHELINFFKKNLSSNTFIETGTYDGQCCFNLRLFFESLYTFETDKRRYKKSSEKLSNQKNINFYLSSGASGIHKYHKNFKDNNCVYWLDAHETEFVGNKASSACDILNEIKAIKSLNSNSVVVIDDARLFLCPPPSPHKIDEWPLINDIFEALKPLSSKHSFMILNDNIILYPNKIKKKFLKFSQNKNFDLLNLFSKEKQLIKDIDILKATQSSLHNMLKEKELVIKNLISANQGEKTLLKPLSFLRLKVLRRLILIFKPRLGNLNQFFPKKININYESKVLNKKFYKFSIVTPSFNQGNYIESTINSVLKQNYPSIQYLVQDGGSNDQTDKILSKYKNFIEFEISPDKGQSDAINKGFYKTDGDIMAWINSDDIYLSNVFYYVNNLFQMNPQIDVIYGNRIIINEKNDMVGRWVLPYHSSRILKYADFVPQETLFWRRSIWNKIGGRLDRSFNFALDWDLLTKFIDGNAKILHCNKYLGAFRLHDSQKTSCTINTEGKTEMDVIRKRYNTNVTKKNLEMTIFMTSHVFVDLFQRTKDRLLNKKNIF